MRLPITIACARRVGEIMKYPRRERETADQLFLLPVVACPELLMIASQLLRLYRSPSPSLHTFFHHFGAFTRFDLQPLLSAPPNVAAIRLLSDNSLESQFLNLDKQLLAFLH